MKIPIVDQICLLFHQIILCFNIRPQFSTEDTSKQVSCICTFFLKQPYFFLNHSCLHPLVPSHQNELLYYSYVCNIHDIYSAS